MRGLATEPADRFETAESFGVALAEAAAQAWGPGWLSAEQVPILDAGPIISAAGQPAAARRAAAPTIAPAEPVTVSRERENPLSDCPPRGKRGNGRRSTETAGVGTGAPGTRPAAANSSSRLSSWLPS